MANYTLKSAVPVLPAKSVAAAVAFYRDQLGFAQLFDMGNYAGIGRDGVEFHLYETQDKPVIARINVDGIDALHSSVPKDAMLADEPLETKPWGLRQFGVVDPTGNRITFAQQLPR